jgi:hypothetical protein
MRCGDGVDDVLLELDFYGRLLELQEQRSK